jgi:nitrate reductase NapD
MRRMRGILPGSCHFHASPSAACAERLASDPLSGKIITMKIVSLVLKFLPRYADSIKAAVEAVPGASVAADSGDGRMIVLLEDGPDHSVSDSIIKVHHIQQVMSITLSYEYSDEAHALEEN